MVPVLAASTWIVSTGKNEVTLDPGLWALYDTLANYVKATNPGCGIAVTAQNPSIAPVAQSTIDQLAIRMAKIEAYAQQRGFTSIPVFTAFKNSPLGLSALTNTDGIHPSDANGSPLWAQTIETLYTAAEAFV
jgi:lysophospholipase L1-like esterase